MSESQRRRLSFGIIGLIIGGIWCVVAFNTARGYTGNYGWFGIGVLILAVGIYLLSRYFILRSRH